MKHPQIHLRLSVTLILLVPFISIAQQATSYYDKQLHLIDSLEHIRPTKREYIQQIVNTYVSLSSKYEIIDPISFFYYSIQCEHPEGLYRSTRLLIQGTGDSINSLISAYGNIYGKNDLSVLQKEPLLSTLNKLRKNEGKEIIDARIKIDWKWNIFLCAMFKSNIDFRYIDASYFKDRPTRLRAMYELDSVHFLELCEMMQLNGFPYRSRVGLNSQKLMAPLLHFTALVDSNNAQTSKYFIEKWKFVLPFLLSEVKNRHLDMSFYSLLLTSIITQISERKNTEDLMFFRKFELHQEQ